MKKPTNLKEKIANVIREEQELTARLDSLHEMKELLATELLDSVKSDSYSLSEFTIYRKSFYKVVVRDEVLADEYFITKKVIDTKLVTKDFKKNGEIAGLEVTETVKVIVRNKAEI